MGYALADAAAARGARVVLVTGPVTLTPPPGVETIRVSTALEMRQAVMDHLPNATIIIKAAAVADYHVATVPSQKVKKTAANLSLELQPTPDILAECGRKKGDRILIGFAAETENLIAEARRKMESKNCDMVVGNLVSQTGIGFDSNEKPWSGLHGRRSAKSQNASWITCSNCVWMEWPGVERRATPVPGVLPGPGNQDAVEARVRRLN
jgi:phosphopantothenoylcysteine decarboxylase / phosphopantothenate---cysteine ligase